MAKPYRQRIGAVIQITGSACTEHCHIHKAMFSAWCHLTVCTQTTMDGNITFALCSTFNDSRQIQQLDLGIIVVNDARYTCERCELIGCYL